MFGTAARFCAVRFFNMRSFLFLFVVFLSAFPMALFIGLCRLWSIMLIRLMCSSSGDCYECMACSDNVVRAGLTPKYRDVSTLCSMLDYTSGAPTMLTPQKVDEFTRAFCPPINDFAFTLTNVPAKKTYELPGLDSASIIFIGEGAGTLVCDGSSEEIKIGDVFVLQPNSKVSVSAKEDLTVARSYSPGQ